MGKPTTMNSSKEIDVENQFLEAYEDYSDAIFRHCYFRLSDRAKAQSVTQETFLRAWEYLESGKEVKNLRALLYKIANNLIIDRYRAKKPLSVEALSEEGFAFSIDDRDKLQDSIAGKEILSVLNELDDLYREAMVLRYVDDLSVQEISEVLGETENAISVRLHRGLKKLKALLEPNHGTENS